MSRSSAARIRADRPANPTSFETATARARPSVALSELDVAPENLRVGEGPDDDIPGLADTLFAAGLLQPLTVRPGRGEERAFMVLDGRRRLLALRLLVEQGRIPEGFAVDVFVETDPARQAAAAVLTNTAVPVHVADVIAAIGRMLKARLGVPAIARALGQAEIDIKRLAALSALPDEALAALRIGRLNLKQARLLARLPDREARLTLARAALDGQGFADWRVSEALDEGRTTASDPRCGLVSPDAYVAAGGRLETDLFDERPPVLLDPAVLTDLWMARARKIAGIFEAEGLTVHVTAADPPDLPEDLEQAGYVHGGLLPADQMAAYREARAARDAVAGAAADLLTDSAGADALEAALVALVRADLVVDQIALGGRVVTTLVLSPDRRTGVQVDLWAPMEPDVEGEEPPEGEAGEADRVDDDAPRLAGARPGADPVVVAPRAAFPEPDVAGIGNTLHRLRTEVATRGLIRALADDPRTAMTALIARLFGAMTGVEDRLASGWALTVGARPFAPAGGRVIPELDGVVRERLDERRAAWEASGETVIGWVNGLPDEDRSALLADLIALSLDLLEERTSLIRRSGRAEAAELARLCGADITRHWTPDAVFLAAHPKALLHGMLDAMGKAAPSGTAPGKPDLVVLVEATAAARRWAPPALSWAAAEAPAEGGEAPPDAPAEKPSDAGPPADEADGMGAFEVTAEGAAALAAAAG